MSQWIEHSPSGPVVAPNDGDARHPVWSVYRLILEHQLLELRNLTKPRLRLGMEVDTLATYAMRNLAQGWDQKTLRRWLTPPVCQPQHDAILEALASWVFATQGVLSHVYHPVLSLHGVAAVVTDRDVPNWGPPVSQHSILLRLPSELFDKVIKYLTAQDVNDVRLTCRESRFKSFDFWSKTFFTKRQFMIDQYSLQTLLDISRHPELHSVLTHLVIGVDEINTKDTLSFLLDMHSTSPKRVATMFRYWRDAAAAQQALLHTGRAIELLSQAMSNLTELKTVSVSGSMISDLLPSSSHIFYYPHLGLRSYGASAYQMQRRNVSYVQANSKGFPDSVFSCVVNSLVRSSPEKLRTLRTNIGRHSNLPHLNDEAFYLPPFAPFLTENPTFLANLTELHLDVNLESRSISRIRRTADHRHTFDPENTSLRQLLCSCYSLVTLNLSVVYGWHSRYHCDFTAWLVGTADNPSVDNPVYWPFLRRLVLKGLNMSPATLRNIFLKFDTIESAALADITLRDCFIDHPPIPRHSQEQLENHWATFFCGSATVLSNLKSLELEQLTVQRWREDPDDAVAIWEKDSAGIVFLLEAPNAGYLETFTVTDFRPKALETLAEQIWFIGDWERARNAAHAEADADPDADPEALVLAGDWF